MSLVKASWTVTFYVLGEPRFDVRCFSHAERRVNQLFRPPVSVFNVNRAPAWAFENNVSVGGHEIGSRADPPEGVNAGALRQFNGPPNEDLTDAPNGLWCVHPGMPAKASSDWPRVWQWQPSHHDKLLPSAKWAFCLTGRFRIYQG
jgi:hypothetical protein